MSTIGKNIRKIRNFHKLNQTQFATMFDLKRANIGSYEEGRAEPKTDTIIAIAKYFSIHLEVLLTKELTVADVSHINTDIHDKVIESLNDTKQKNLPTLFVHNHQQEEYILTGTLRHIEKLRLPVPQNFNTIAFQVIEANIRAFNSFDINEGDIIIGSQVNRRFIENLPYNDCYIAVTKQGVRVDSLTQILKKIAKEHIKELWTVIGNYKTNFKQPSRIEVLEKRIRAIETKID